MSLLSIFVNFAIFFFDQDDITVLLFNDWQKLILLLLRKTSLRTKIVLNQNVIKLKTEEITNFIFQKISHYGGKIIRFLREEPSRKF